MINSLKQHTLKSEVEFVGVGLLYGLSVHDDTKTG